MKATINRQLFIENISPIPATNGVSILIADGILSVASFGQGAIGRIPAYVLSNGQAFLKSEQWSQVVSIIENSPNLYTDINI
ncbi:hypothetical protein [Pelosinus baikalensis]|uniref:Uncharacterized protein n=1 Tax=Pelosinus baikalensis TaxID=2892015 RepID=A0ABS8HZM7_9FIRM|nr:hypothetical protein [Pelosinus baikalensis]MCC5468634.1 hypothetical protein [Pelosinus baikalensis]